MKKPWQMNHRELVEHCAQIAERYVGDPDAPAKIAAEIRTHARQWKCTKQEVHDLHLKHPEWTTRELAEALDVHTSFVNQCQTRGGWKARRLTKDELAEVNRQSRLKHLADSTK